MGEVINPEAVWESLVNQEQRVSDRARIQIPGEPVTSKGSVNRIDKSLVQNSGSINKQLQSSRPASIGSGGYLRSNRDKSNGRLLAC
jgi:hypothetical protein